jgi:CRP/FNR family transcriptional regulator
VSLPPARLAQAAPGWPRPLVEAVAARSQAMRFPDGQPLFGPGDRAAAFMIPLSGCVRVEHVGASGRSVVLYRVGPGDSCVVTTACLLSGAPYQAYGVAEGAVEAAVLSPEGFRALLTEQPGFRDEVLTVFSARIVELVTVIDELLLHRVDVRLAAWLAERAAEPIPATHQAIAAELGTAREVVSRILKDFERRGWVALSRGQVTVTDAAALSALSAAR